MIGGSTYLNFRYRTRLVGFGTTWGFFKFTEVASSEALYQKRGRNQK